MKVWELVNAWDPSGDGIVSRDLFRTQVIKLGLEGGADELDELFDSLDEDGGGTLDLDEMKHALRTLQEHAQTQDKDLTRLKRTTTELAWKAKEAQVEWRRIVREDEQEEAARAEAARREEEEREAKEMRAAQVKANLLEVKAAAQAAAKAEYEAKIAARRAAQPK